MAIGCWLLAFGCWLLAVGCWLLAVGYWLLAVGCWQESGPGTGMNLISNSIEQKEPHLVI